MLPFVHVAKVKNSDGLKRRMRLKDAMTMTTGLEWNDEMSYRDPPNDFTPAYSPWPCLLHP